MKGGRERTVQELAFTEHGLGQASGRVIQLLYSIIIVHLFFSPYLAVFPDIQMQHLWSFQWLALLISLSGRCSLEWV